MRKQIEKNKKRYIASRENETLAPVSSWKTIHDDRNKNAWRLNLFRRIRQDLEQSPAIIKITATAISTLLRHCLKLSILEKFLIYNFFLVFHIVYIFAFK